MSFEVFRNPDAFWRPRLAKMVQKIWKPRYVGFDHIPESGACILISNHVSYVDGLIIASACKRPVRFVIDGAIYHLPIVHYFMKHNRAIPILPNKESVTAALEEIASGLESGDAICIFPEGRLTYTGSLSRFRPGIEWMIKRNAVPVYPIALVGLWGSVFSRKYRKSFFRWWPRRWKSNIVALCGEQVAPENVQVNHLQRLVLHLKHKANILR